MSAADGATARGGEAPAPALWIRYDAEPGTMPLVHVDRADGGSIETPATDEELAAYLRKHPSDAAYVEPAIIRRCMRDVDGEFLALIAARAALLRQASAGGEPSSGQRAAIAKSLRRICDAPIAGAAGALSKLCFVLLDMDARDGPSAVQRRQLVTAAMEWLAFHVAGKPLDVDDLAKLLRGIRERAAGGDASIHRLAGEWRQAANARGLSDEETDRAADRATVIEEQLARFGALTPSGIGAKLEIVAALATLPQSGERLMASIAADLDRLAGP